MEDFTFYDFEKRSVSTNRLTSNQVRIYTMKGNYAIYFNANVSKKIAEHALCFLRIAKNNLTGELYFVFNNKVGCKVKWTGQNIVIYNKDMAQFLAKECSLNDKCKEIINITRNLSNTQDFFTYKIDSKTSWNI